MSLEHRYTKRFALVESVIGTPVVDNKDFEIAISLPANRANASLYVLRAIEGRDNKNRRLR